jgi:hypothetical protein
VLSELGDHHSFLLTPEQATELAAGGGQSFGLTALSPERVVVDVEPGGAAARAGVKVGDLVESVDGRPVQGDEVVTLPAPTTGGQPAGAAPAPAAAGCRAHQPAHRQRGRGSGHGLSGPPGRAELRRADGRRPHRQRPAPPPRRGRALPDRGHRGRPRRPDLRGRIRPDQPVATDWTRYGTPADPVLRAATAWLNAGCAGR